MNGKNESLYDGYLLEQGIVTLNGMIDARLAQIVINEILYLSNKHPARPIQLWINSPGGEVNAGFAIYDVMNYVKPEIHTVAMGTAASMAAFLLSSGTRGKRSAFANAEIMIHQPLGGVQGQATDIINAAKNIESVRKHINMILAKNCRQTMKKIALDTDRDKVMTAREAMQYGLIDSIIGEAMPKAW